MEYNNKKYRKENRNQINNPNNVNNIASNMNNQTQFFPSRSINVNILPKEQIQNNKVTQFITAQNQVNYNINNQIIPQSQILERSASPDELVKIAAENQYNNNIEQNEQNNEVPDIKITRKKLIEKEEEKKPEEKRNVYPSYKDRDNMVKSDNKEDGTASMRNKYRHRIKTDEKEQSTPEKQTQHEIKEFKPMEDKEETKTKKMIKNVKDP